MSGLEFCVCSLSPAGAVGGAGAGGNGAYDIICSWDYVCDVLCWLFVRNVVNNRGGGGERQDHAQSDKKTSYYS